MNPFPPNSTLHWLLEMPKEDEFKEYPAVITNAGIEMHHTAIPIYVVNINASESLGAHYAIGGIPQKHAAHIIQDALKTFGVANMQQLAGIKCLVCLWHGRSVAIRNPTTKQLHFPEKLCFPDVI